MNRTKCPEKLSQRLPGRLLLTGAGGFIGQQLAKTLQHRGYDVTEIRDRRALDLRDEVCTAEFITDLQPSTIIHLAASRDNGRSIEEYKSEFENTIRCTHNLVAAVPRSMPCLFIHVGSYKQYGRLPLPFRETDSPKPTTGYGLAKNTSEYLVRLRTDDDFQAVFLRLSTVYGPGQPSGRLIPKLITSFLTQPIAPVKLSDAMLDLTYISDSCTAIANAALSVEARGRTINIGSGNIYTPRSINDFITEILSNRQSNSAGWVSDGPGANSYGDVRLAHAILDWKPAVDIKSGLRLCIDSIKSQTDSF